MADVKKLHEKRASLLTEATSIVADLAEKGAALEGEAQVRFESLTNEASTIAAAIRSEKDASEARSAADSARAEFAAVIAPKVEKSDDEVAELRALGRNGGTRSFEYRDVTKSTGLGNPVSIASMVNVVAAQFNPFLDPNIVTVVRTANGNNIQFPRVTALGTAGSVAEAGTINESDGTLSALSLTPIKYATIIQVTEELVEDAVFDLAAMIADKCGAEVAVAHGAFAGTAIAAAAAAGVTGSGTTINPNYTDLAKLKAAVNQVYRRAPKAGWLMNDTTLGVVTGLVDTTGQPIFRAGDANTPDRLLGAPVYSAALIDLTDNTAGSILFGDLGQIYTALVGGVRVDVSREFAWNTGLVSYKVEVRGATGLAQASAVKSFKSADVA
ncbi:major_cap_HK97, phage major capsid protein, HK97 family [uncultured Caudovirales phage]|uniref:Major_cap_HK97, phage major capsid protein, HK97 family n=1 Tax=uncultured Caudovirales phage TaxID=2100421 RepID=A0A6J5RCJ6_9CAUD|nr:major_cap_HK97, phage major capsid protein, HK97 family [uncultured Caudovirales phage]